MISEAQRTNFDTLQRAFEHGQVALLEVRERSSGEVRAAIVALNREEDGVSFVPFALMVDGDPFEELDPPNPDGGFYGAEVTS